MRTKACVRHFDTKYRENNKDVRGAQRHAYQSCECASVGEETAFW